MSQWTVTFKYQRVNEHYYHGETFATLWDSLIKIMQLIGSYGAQGIEELSIRRVSDNDRRS